VTVCKFWKVTQTKYSVARSTMKATLLLLDLKTTLAGFGNAKLEFVADVG
jgi:hypothetical protein